MVIVLAAFSVILKAGFAFDDFDVVTDQLAVHSLPGLVDKLMPSHAAQLGEATYRPLTSLTYVLTYAAFGSLPAAHHAVDWLLHALAAGLLFLLLQRLGLSAAAAVFGALVFALHPLTAGVVSMISFREEPLVAVLGLAILLLLYQSTAKWRTAAALVLLFLISFAKETGIAFAVIPFFLPDRRGAARWKRTIWCAASGGSATLLLLAVNRYVTGGLAAAERTSLAWPQRFYTAGQTLYCYARRLVFWRELSPVHDDWPLPTGPTPAVIFGLALLAFAVFALVRYRHSLGGLAASLVIFPLLPTLNLLLPFWVKQADRYCYVPLLALGLGAAVLYDKARTVSPRARSIAPVAGVLILAVFLAGTWRELPRYRSSYDLFASVAARQPNSALGKLYFAQELIDRRRDREAQPLLVEVLAKHPRDLKAANSLAETYVHLGHPALAVRLLEHRPLIGVDGPTAAVTLQAAYFASGDLDAGRRLTDEWLRRPDTPPSVKQILAGNAAIALRAAPATTPAP